METRLKEFSTERPILTKKAILTFLKHPTKLFFAELPGNRNGSLLPPMKTLLDVSMEKEPDVNHVSL